MHVLIREKCSRLLYICKHCRNPPLALFGELVHLRPNCLPPLSANFLNEAKEKSHSQNFVFKKILAQVKLRTAIFRKK